MRFTAFATRMASPCIPLDSEWLSSASTMRWRWLPSTENSTSRKPNRPRAAAKHCRIWMKRRELRRLGTSPRMRSVTWTGVIFSNRGRAR